MSNEDRYRGVPQNALHLGQKNEDLRADKKSGTSMAGGMRSRPDGGRGLDFRALVAALAADDVVASDRDSNLRVSLHLYNTENDVDAVLAAPRAAHASPSVRVPGVKAAVQYTLPVADAVERWASADLGLPRVR